jgi:S1-C subfamily serine protease
MNNSFKAGLSSSWRLDLTCVLIAGLFFLAVQAPADDLADKGRAIFKKNQHSVVTVQIVVKSKFSFGGMGGQANESRQDVTGTVVDPSGLTVVSLSATDPGQMVQSIMSGMSDDESKFKMETELSDLKILLEDGTEAPAEVILRDKDKDLAFIRPKSKLSTPITALDLANSGKAELLDQVIALNRLGNAAGRAYAASVERISAIVDRPRLFYIPESSMTTTSLGAPAFTLDGKVLGIFVMRALKGPGGGSGAMGMLSMPTQNMTSIIVPVDDIVKAVKQVPTAAEEKEKENEGK